MNLKDLIIALTLGALIILIGILKYGAMLT
jgi:hypothetical protein